MLQQERALGKLTDRHVVLHGHLGPEAFHVAENRCNSQHASAAFEAQQAVPGRDVAFDRELVPLLGMADIVDPEIVVAGSRRRARR